MLSHICADLSFWQVSWWTCLLASWHQVRENQVTVQQQQHLRSLHTCHVNTFSPSFSLPHTHAHWWTDRQWGGSSSSSRTRNLAGTFDDVHLSAIRFARSQARLQHSLGVTSQSSFSSNAITTSAIARSVCKKKVHSVDIEHQFYRRD